MQSPSLLPPSLKCKWESPETDKAKARRTVRSFKHKEDDIVESRFVKQDKVILSKAPERASARPKVVAKETEIRLPAPNHKYPLKNSNGDPPHKTTVTIRDLGEEDQKRIAAIISELATTTEEKEKLQTELETLAEKLHQEKSHFEKDKNMLKTKLSEKEQLVNELQDKLALSQASSRSLSGFSKEAQSDQSSTISYQPSVSSFIPSLASKSITVAPTPLKNTNPFLENIDDCMPWSHQRTHFTRDDWLHCFQTGAFSGTPLASPRSAFQPCTPRLTNSTFSPRPSVMQKDDLLASVETKSESSIKAVQDLLLAQQKRLDELSEQLQCHLKSRTTTPLTDAVGSITPANSTCFVPIKVLNSFSVESVAEHASDVSSNIASSKHSQQQSHSRDTGSSTLSTASSNSSLQHHNLSADVVPMGQAVPLSGRVTASHPKRDAVHKVPRCQKPSPTTSLLDIIDSLESRSYFMNQIVSSRGDRDGHGGSVGAMELGSTPSPRSDSYELNDPVLNDLFFLK